MTETLSLAGLRLAYDAAGAGDPPMIFVHGWCCDRSYFAPQFEHFASGHTVVAMDLRGHGDSGRPAASPGGYDVDAMADDVLSVADAANCDRPVLVGHSLGALIGLACAARAGAIRALVMVDPAPITNEKAKRFFRESVAAVAADDNGSWRTTFVEGMFLPTDAARRAVIIEQMTRTSPAISAEVMQVMGEFDDRLGRPLQRVRRSAPPVPCDHRRPDRRLRSFQPTRSARPGECHDRALPCRQWPVTARLGRRSGPEPAFAVVIMGWQLQER